MARYIKANPKVARYLHLENDRNQVKDGNYLLWQNDMLAFGRLTELPQILEQIGGIALQAHEARQEQDGTINRELPTATDDRFVVETDEPETETMEPEQTEPQPETDNTEIVEPEQTESEETESGEVEETPTAEPEDEPEAVEPEQTENEDEAETNNEETEA